LDCDHRKGKFNMNMRLFAIYRTPNKFQSTFP